jgi:ComF family protein
MFFGLFPNACAACGLPSGRGWLCADCVSALEPAPALLPEGAWDALEVPFAYQQPLKRLLHDFKYHGHVQHTQGLAALLQPQTRPDLLLPVPLHPKRLQERGFNQALELAKPLGKRLGVKVAGQGLQRLRDTPHQVGLSREARLHNLAGAFAVNAPVQGLEVAVLDEVITTGSTLSVLAEALKAAGARKVTVWALMAA